MSTSIRSCALGAVLVLCCAASLMAQEPLRPSQPDDTQVGGNGKPFIFEGGKYRLKILAGDKRLTETTEIGWSIPPAWMVNTTGPSAHGSGAVRPLLKRGGDWGVGMTVEFESGWSSYRLPFGIYAIYMASGNASAGAHVDTVHGGFYPPSPLYFKITKGPAANHWDIYMDFWVDGRFDDLHMSLERVGDQSR